MPFMQELGQDFFSLSNIVLLLMGFGMVLIVLLDRADVRLQ